jgi:hypothetical protein
MKYCYKLKGIKLILALFLFMVLGSKQSLAQLIYQPYSYQFYQKLNVTAYSPATNLHTSLKPYLIDDSSAIRSNYDLLMQSNTDNPGKSWLHQALFNTHLADIKHKEYTFYLDYLPDLQLGREFDNKKTTYLNTRAYQLSATIGSNFFMYTSGYENQGSFANYENAYINKTGMVPGQAYGRNTTYSTSDDWAYVTTLIGYRFNKSVTLVMGEDKTFIGDGYRSVLLSDYASAYPLLRLTVNIGKNIQYMAMWAYLEDQNAVQLDTSANYRNYRRKWGAFHYVDWNITKRASLGFFNALMAEEANNNGVGHGFDINYVNPVLFSSSLGNANGATDHTLIGFNGKYKIGDKTTVYGQLLLDQAISGANNSKDAWQLGFRGADLFKINGFNYLVEYNTAAPYTYSDQSPIVSYAQLSEPLAHPFGANFKEWLGILNYSLGRFDFQGQLDYARYGLNTGNMNYGKDITLANNIGIPSGNSITGQGLATTLKYAEGTVSYVLNPKYNLRIEIGGLLRQEKNSQTDTKTALVTFGLRSSFRNLYHDF